ncbi:MAG: branched-chain amino acid ABC transporter permease [Acidovorax sp.]|uniref:branched-chain amino acid ABC transporter permease n=1 Tax=Acidovorax sp. TaxID=1872122 RepID=UPI00391C39D1
MNKVWFPSSSTARIATVLVLACAVIWPLLFTSRFGLSLGVLVGLNMIGAVSLHLIIRTGHISLGHAAFMGVGGYACVLFAMKTGLPAWIGLAVGMVAPAILAMIVGPIVLRLTGKYFVLVTFLLGEIVRLVFVEWISVTGGANGILEVPALHPKLDSAFAMYYVILAFAVVCVGFSAALLRSEYGRIIDSVREAPNISEAAGIPVLAVKVRVFVIACAMAGLQGGLLALYLKYIDPNTYAIQVSLNLVVMNIIGGMYNIVGPLIGAVFLVALPELLRGFVEIQQIIFGVVLIVVMASFPGGMVEIYDRVGRAWARRRLRAAESGKEKLA